MGQVVTYSTDLRDVQPSMLQGFFVGWPQKPTPDLHHAALVGSYRVVLAWQDDRIIGFINAISDGIAAAFIPWLEVRPEYQGRGVGRELVTRLLDQLAPMYSVDLTCDPELGAYYRTLGFRELLGMGIRHPEAFEAPSPD